MTRILKNITTVLALVVVSSCSKLDINENPVNPVTVPSTQRLAAIEANLAYSLYSQARWGAYHSYYLTTRTGNSNAQTDTWNYNSITRLGAWRWHYFDVGSNIIGQAGMIVRAKEEGSNNYIGVGKIMLALSYLSATDVFGDMPMKEAYIGSFNPLYDSQEEILKNILVLLDEGVADLNNVSDQALSMNAKTDIIYQGDLNKWKGLAEAVRARVKLRTANFQNGHQELLTIVNKAIANFSDALYTYPKGSTSSWQRNLWGPSGPPPAGEAFQFADIKSDLETTLPTDVLMKSLTIDEVNKVYDPRLLKLTTPGVNNKYLGAKMSEGLRDVNLPTGTVYQDFANLRNGFWTSDDSPYPILLKEELYFIKAETQFYLGDTEGALASYHTGIDLNLRRLGVAEGQIISYMGSAKVAQNASALTIADIMLQKYIALYLQGETWTDIRRYGYSKKAYPNLYYPRYALTEWTGRYIQRLPYDPQTEYVYNPKEIARLGASARDWVFKPVWWAEKSTLKD